MRRATNQMMPLHGRFAFDQQKGGFAGGIAVAFSDRKSRLDPNRLEKATPGYTLVDLHGGYERGHLQIAAGVDNILNPNYQLPLGGVNVDDFMASGRTSQLNPLTGRGRSAWFSLRGQF